MLMMKIIYHEFNKIANSQFCATTAFDGKSRADANSQRENLQNYRQFWV